jgi:hypothetical protein
MGGKRLVFPKRRKFVPQDDKKSDGDNNGVSAEEHEQRMKVLRDMGLVK